MTGWRAVHAVMQAAGLGGPQASPKGLRHGSRVAAVSAGIPPLNLVQQWLGHARLTTTAIYADAVSAEEKDIARRTWVADPRLWYRLHSAAHRVDTWGE